LEAFIQIFYSSVVGDILLKGKSLCKFLRHTRMKPNSLVGVHTLLVYIWEGLGSNLGLETSYPERFFVVFCTLFRHMPG
jgi:hypothetical protein